MEKYPGNKTCQTEEKTPEDSGKSLIAWDM